MKKRILVTGAGSGFGRDCVLGLAGRGHEVIAAVHHPDEIAQINDEASARGVSLRAEKLDLYLAPPNPALAAVTTGNP